jgi:hypothetical protein
LVGTTADFRRVGPPRSLPFNDLPGENSGTAGRIGEVGLPKLPPVESTHSLSERIDVEIADGCAIVFSDCHYDPDAPASTAHRAVVHFAKSLQPDLLICGGDAFDWAGLSTKHARIMWEPRPSPIAELAIGQKRLREIEMASPKSRRLFTIGNHDQRMAQYLSANAPQLEGLHGSRIEDFLPSWEFAWAVWLNPHSQIPTVVKHRMGSGPNAARSNATKGGTHTCTGHTHHLQIVAHTDWSGTKWGIDTGCVADVNSRFFTAYTEKGCTGWRSGAAVLQWASGEMLPPELIQVVKEDPVPGNGRVFFRGKLWPV